MYLLIDVQGYDETKLTLGTMKDIENLLDEELLNYFHIQKPNTIARVVSHPVDSSGRSEPRLLVAWHGGPMSDSQTEYVIGQVMQYLKVFQQVPPGPVVTETEPQGETPAQVDMATIAAEQLPMATTASDLAQNITGSTTAGPTVQGPPDRIG